jgi:hypothetical protein
MSLGPGRGGKVAARHGRIAGISSRCQLPGQLFLYTYHDEISSAALQRAALAESRVETPTQKKIPAGGEAGRAELELTPFLE